MALCRPAGFSDDDCDSDDDDYGYFSKIAPQKVNLNNYENDRKKTENNLQEAIINNDIAAVAKIISFDLNDNVDTRLESGWTPLLHACFHAQEKIVNFLLDKGADPNLHADSVTPIMMACSNTSANESVTYDVVSTLMKKDCIMNIGDKYGLTPLMRTVCNGRESVVKLILEKQVNIEMRDRQGWTAVFWAIHHNQPNCLNILLDKGARLNLVDTYNRTPFEIANSHDYPEILDILSKHLKSNNEGKQNSSDREFHRTLTDWQDYYPGCKGHKPTYCSEIDNLLYGMSCERLQNIFRTVSMDLRTFLLLEEEDMIKLGIDMPFERQRLKHGLRRFHVRSWKVNAVAGLYARRGDSYSIVECLTVLGNHSQQMYILEATLAYTLREYGRIENQFKFEPPDSPIITRLNEASSKMIANINNIRKEIKIMKNYHLKINKENLKPADYIMEKSTREIAKGYITELVIICSIGLLVYNAKTIFINIIKQ